MLEHLSPDNVKVTITIDDIRLKTILKINQTLKFTKKSFFHTFLGFTQSHSYNLNNIDGFYQLIAGSYKSDKPINITGVDKVHSKCDCIAASIVNGVREPLLYSFGLSTPPGHKTYKTSRILLFKKVNNSVLFHINFYLEDDGHKPVDFNNEVASFTCQLIEKMVKKMNLNIIRPKNETDVVLLSITKNCETFILQTHTKPQETLKFRLNKSRITFHFNPPISIERSWRTGLTSLEIYNSIFNITQQNIKFELYTDTFDEFPFPELKDELEETLSISDITPQHLQHEKIDPRIIETYKKFRSKKSITDGYNTLLRVMLDHHLEILKVILEV